MDENHIGKGPDEHVRKLSEREHELVKELLQAYAAGEQPVQYEVLDDYEVPPRTQFSMLKKPAVTISKGQIVFNTACIRLFEGVQYVLPVINEKKHRLAVIPCKEEELSSIDWARKGKDGIWVNKQITNRDLVSKIGAFMVWRSECRYKTLGEVRMSARGPILVFELDEAIMMRTDKEEYLDEETGKTKVRRKQIKYYPEKYKGRIGLSYSDYAEIRQTSMFEDFSNYFSQDGGLVNGISFS